MAALFRRKSKQEPQFTDPANPVSDNLSSNAQNKYYVENWGPSGPVTQHQITPQEALGTAASPGSHSTHESSAPVSDNLSSSKEYMNGTPQKIEVKSAAGSTTSAEPTSFTSDTGSNIHDGHPTVGGDNPSAPAGYQAGSGSDFSAHTVDHEGRPITISTMNSGAQVEQVAGGTPYQIKAPEPTQAGIQKSINAFEQEEGHQAPAAASASSHELDGVGRFMVNQTASQTEQAQQHFANVAQTHSQDQAASVTDAEIASANYRAADIANKVNDSIAAPSPVAVSTPDPAFGDDPLDRFRENHTAATVSPTPAVSPSPSIPEPGITLPAATPDSNVVNLSALSPSAAADYIVPHGKVGME